MAIKSFDPRKHLEHELHSQRFEQLVVDAWDEVHEADTAAPPPPRPERRSQYEVSGLQDDELPSNQPVAVLGDALKRH